MSIKHGHLREPQGLDELECARLLESQRLGRVAYTDGALPQVLPVFYSMDGPALVFRAGARSRLAECVVGNVVGFEADNLGSEGLPKWIVRIVACVEDVTVEASSAVRYLRIDTQMIRGEMLAS